MIDKKDFVIAALDTNNETFVMYVVLQKREKMPVYFKKQFQIKAQVGVLLFNKALIEVSIEYFDYNNIFSAENAAKLPENTGINEYAIKLEEGK